MGLNEEDAEDLVRWRRCGAEAKYWRQMTMAVSKGIITIGMSRFRKQATLIKLPKAIWEKTHEMGLYTWPKWSVLYKWMILVCLYSLLTAVVKVARMRVRMWLDQLFGACPYPFCKPDHSRPMQYVVTRPPARSTATPLHFLISLSCYWNGDS